MCNRRKQVGCGQAAGGCGGGGGGGAVAARSASARVRNVLGAYVRLRTRFARTWPTFIRIRSRSAIFALTRHVTRTPHPLPTKAATTTIIAYALGCSATPRTVASRVAVVTDLTHCILLPVACLCPKPAWAGIARHVRGLPFQILEPAGQSKSGRVRGVRVWRGYVGDSTDKACVRARTSRLRECRGRSYLTPSTHSRQLACCTTGWYLPFGQFLHCVVRPLCFPVVLSSARGAKRPLSQAVQDVTPLFSDH